MSLAPQSSARDATQLHLVRGEPAARGARRSPLELWHLLSLDAPTVATLWTAFVAWCAGVRLSFIDLPAMFLAVWMLYAADRLLDARPLSFGLPVTGLEERHRFHHRYRRRFLPCLVFAAIPLAAAVDRLPGAEVTLYAALAALLAGWLLLVHVQPASAAGSRRLPKEIATGLFFPAAIFIPTVARAPALRPLLLPGALLLAFACVLDCLFLYAWEHPSDQGNSHVTTRWSLGLLVPFAWGLVCVGTVIAAGALANGPPVAGSTFSFGTGVGITSLAHPAALPAASALSGLLLLLLHGMRRRISTLRLRALTDTALLTPLLPMVLAACGVWR